MIYAPHERGTSVRIFQFHYETVSFRIMRCLFELWQEYRYVCVCVGVCVSVCVCVCVWACV